MKYTKSQKSAFPFRGEPLKMYGGMKDSPMRSWWSKVKEKVAGVAAKVKGAVGSVFGGGGGEAEGGGVSSGGVPQHGPEAHSGGGRPGIVQGGQGKWGPGGDGRLGTTEGTGDMGGEGGDPTQGGSQKWRGGRG